jgi:hypothetical protein
MAKTKAKVAAKTKTPAKAAKPGAAKAKSVTPAKTKPAATATAKQIVQKPKAKSTAQKPTAQKPWAGQRWGFFGEFAVWPAYHGTSPEGVAARRGATITDTLDERLAAVVLGSLRGTGRAEAQKKAAKLGLNILDEAAYRELVRIDLTGKRFAFAGGFDCSPSGLDDGLLAKMVTAAGGVVTTDVDDKLDYLAIGHRRGDKKIATVNKAKKLIDAGAPVTLLEEDAFLDLVRLDKPATAGELDFAGFISQLYGHVDKAKLGRALDMLRKDRFQLFTKLDGERLVGVVRSQSGSGNVYASWLGFDGRYGCAQPDLEDCMGLQGECCKHLMVLVVGLARTGQMTLAQALQWMEATAGKGPKKNDELCAETLIQYKGAEAGEVDWRPTETIPEDFYAV